MPLSKPYELALGTLLYFDAFVVNVSTKDASAWGEVCALPGYHFDTPEEIWDFLVGFSKKIVGKNIEEAFGIIRADRARGYFKTSAIELAIENLMPLQDRHASVANSDAGNIPLIGVLGLNEQTEDDARKLLQNGCKSIKIKIGSNVEQELKMLRKYSQSSLLREFQIRFDANQSLNLESAEKFCGLISKYPALYLEQPFGIDDWDLTAQLCKRQGVPIMLDESIYNAEDIKRSKEIGVQWIKLKLAKHGACEDMRKLAEYAQELRLGVIMGNGVATDISCFYEGRVWSSLSGMLAGEMNGFCKMKNPLNRDRFDVENFIWHFPALKALNIDEKSLALEKKSYYEIGSSQKIESAYDSRV